MTTLANSERDVQVPHFSLPFKFHSVSGQIRASVTEQDTVEEIGDCVEALVRCPRGSRIDDPEYGIDDLTFTSAGIDLESLKDDILRFESRAKFSILEEADEWDRMKRRINIIVQTPPDVTREEVEEPNG